MKVRKQVRKNYDVNSSSFGGSKISPLLFRGVPCGIDPSGELIHPKSMGFPYVNKDNKLIALVTYQDSDDVYEERKFGFFSLFFHNLGKYIACGIDLPVNTRHFLIDSINSDSVVWLDFRVILC